MAEKKIRVLSIDGGGMRGVYSATYLHRLANDTAKRKQRPERIDLGKCFDLIVGTSTGAILACALALNIDLGKVVELYKTVGPQIFERRLPEWSMPKGPLLIATDVSKRAASLKSGTRALRSALEATFGQRTILDVHRERAISLAIPATDLATGKSWVFKTPHLKSSIGRDNDCTLVDVCLASSAAPIYRSLAPVELQSGGISNKRTFIDGGLWANNPVLIGFLDALELAEHDEEIEIFCVGTCSPPSGEDIAEENSHWGLVEWKFGGRIPEFCISAQEYAYDNMARMFAKHVRSKCSIIRLPKVDVPNQRHQYLGLDDTRKEAIDALISQAHSDADNANRWCQEDPEGQRFVSAISPDDTAKGGISAS